MKHNFTRSLYVFFIVLILSCVFSFAPKISIKSRQLILHPNDEKKYSSNVFERVLNHWDVEHYFYLAKNGYKNAGVSAAFFPLWPTLLKSTLPLPSTVRWILILLWQLLMWLIIFNGWSRLLNQTGPPQSEWSKVGVALLTFPSTVFLVAPYPEATFLALVILILLCLKYNQAAALFLCLVALIHLKHIGLLAAPALVLATWINGSTKMKLSSALACLVGTAHLLWFYYQQTGDPFAWLQAQAHWNRSLGTPLHFLWDLRGKPLDWIFFSLIALTGWATLIKRQWQKRHTLREPSHQWDWSLFFYTMAILTPVLFGGSSQSIYRIVMLAFPSLLIVVHIYDRLNPARRPWAWALWIMRGCLHMYKFSSGLHLP